MDTFAETAVVIYRLSFAEQWKRTSVFRFCLQQTNAEVYCFRCLFEVNKRKLPFSISSGFRLRNPGTMETAETWRWRHGNIETWKHREMEAWRHGLRDMDMKMWRHRTENGKWNMEALVIFLNHFTICTSCKQKFVFSVWRTNKCELTLCKETKRTKRTCPSMIFRR